MSLVILLITRDRTANKLLIVLLFKNKILYDILSEIFIFFLRFLRPTHYALFKLHFKKSNCTKWNSGECVF